MHQAAEADVPPHVGTQVGLAVARAGLTHASLAAEAKVDPATVSAFLNGQRWPRAVTLSRIERTLGWPMGSIERLNRGQTTLEEIVAAAPNADPGVDRDRTVHFNLAATGYEDLTAEEYAEANAAATAAFLRTVREIRAAR